MSDSIENLLLEKGVNFKTNPNNPGELMIQCFSGLHEDKNPSLGYNIEKGLFHCFSCGFSGNTEKMLKTLGITDTISVDTKQGYKIRKLLKKLDKIRFGTDIRLPEPRSTIKFSFKGINSSTLQEFSAFTTSAEGLENYICIPVYQHGKLRFVEGRYRSLAKNITEPKYKRKPSGSEVLDVLFPLDKIKNFDIIILVEGIFDMLNMYDLGYKNTLCYFGVENFNAGKARTLDEYGCKKVIILADGDTPGKRAAKKIAQILESRNIETIIIELEEGKDPGSLTEIEAHNLLKDILGE